MDFYIFFPFSSSTFWKIRGKFLSDASSITILSVSSLFENRQGNGEFPIIFLLLFHEILLHEENFFLKLFSKKYIYIRNYIEYLRYKNSFGLRVSVKRQILHAFLHARRVKVTKRVVPRRLRRSHLCKTIIVLA